MPRLWNAGGIRKNSGIRDMTKDDALEQVAKLFDSARGNLRQHGNLVPVAIAWSAEKGCGITELSNFIGEATSAREAGEHRKADHMKAFLWDSLRTVLKNNHAYGVVVIAEAWVAFPSPEEVRYIGADSPELARIIDVPRPSQHSSRREAIMLQWEFHTDDAGLLVGSRNQFFRRDSSGGILLEEVAEFRADDGERLSGGATGLLPRNPPT